MIARPFRSMVLCVGGLLVAISLGGCGGDSGTDPVSYDGTWVGTTSQGGAFSFTVSGNAVSTVTIEYSLTGNCSPSPSGEATTYTPARPISGKTFSISGSSSYSGTFNSATAASGIFNIDFTGNPPGCSSTANGTWTAAQ